LNEPAIIVIGSGGHAIVVADALLAAGEIVLGFTDADRRRHGLCLCGLPVLGDDDVVLASHSKESARLVNGIGGVRGTALRQRVQQRLEAQEPHSLKYPPSSHHAVPDLNRV
jgi:FlaA1/EpsC-like NDP-sugar epimerase